MARHTVLDDTPQEAAALAGVPPQRVQNAITNHQFGRTFVSLERGAASGRPSPRADVCARRKAGLPRGPVAITDAMTIDAHRLLGTVLRNIEPYARPT